ncbi:MAG: MBL fold metallo-hydrolase [Candidatus Methylomirabilia bacterium]
MTTEVAPGVFRLQIPVPFKLGHVNLYLIDGGEGFILVDTGVATPEAFAAVHAGLKGAGIGYGDLSEVVVTHFHADHSGQAGHVQKRSKARVLMGDRDAAYLDDFFRNGPPWESDEFFSSHGVLASSAKEFREILPALARLITPFSPDGTLATGDRIGSGRELIGLLTPGHTPGHLCVLLPEEGLLLSGDHVLPHITPHIGLYSNADPNPLGSYLSSLDAVSEIAPRRIFPAHGPVIEDPQGRIRELLEHHRRRLDMILSTMRSPGLTAWEVSRAIFGDELDHAERWMAFFESLAHLEYLVSKGALSRLESNARVVYLRPS